MNILSLFDGISCGKLALERAGIPITKYYASEIDKYASQVSEYNHPDIVRVGDACNWHFWDSLHGLDWSKIDLLMAGFPCQSWSISGKQGGIDDPRGKLAWVTNDILQHVKRENPNVKFLFENTKMKKENLEYLNNLFGVEPIEINSALVSAQNRKRLYWHNLGDIEQPDDKGILLKDIVHENCETDRDKSHCITSSIGRTTEREYFDKNQGQMVADFNVNPSGKGMNGLVYSIESLKSKTLTTNKGEGQKISVALNEYIVPFDKTLQILDKEVERGKVGYFRKDSQSNRVYYIQDKSVTLCGDAGGDASKIGQYLFGCITPDRINKNKNGQRFNNGKKFYTLTAQDKHGILIEGYIRKLTPIECCRLQTLPDDYFFTKEGDKIVSNSQQYKAVGNGWTVDVISHILKNLLTNNPE